MDETINAIKEEMAAARRKRCELINYDKHGQALSEYIRLGGYIQALEVALCLIKKETELAY